MGEKRFVQQMFSELNGFFNVHDMSGAEACMEKYLQIAREQNDWQSELTILNEQIGFYRKAGNVSAGMRTIDRAFRLVEDHGLSSHEAGATTWLNGATAFRAFKEYETSYIYFKKTMELYLNLLRPFDYRFASLYNNFALLLIDMKRYEEAEAYFEKSLIILETDPDSGAEMATTCVSMAHMYHSMELKPERKQEKIKSILLRAWKLLSRWEMLPDSYFAYVCDICSKSFFFFGLEKEGADLKRRSEEYYQAQQNQLVSDSESK